MSNEIAQYYSRRAPKYDRLYQKPERQADLAAMSAVLREVVAGRRVLEIACGTGYWTEVMAETATFVLATDLNESMLAEARKRSFPRQNVALERQDLFALPDRGGFDAAFGGFIWSHLRRPDLERMLEQLHRQLRPGSRVVFADNRFVDDSNLPIAQTDAEGNTYQQRRLDDGSEFLIMKNFPTRADFAAVLEGKVPTFEWQEFAHYWFLHYTLPA